MQEITGSCLCGAVSFSGRCNIQRIINCHCADCQKTTGSAFGTLVFVPESEIAIQGATRNFTHFSDRGSAMTKSFCPNCGVQMLSHNSKRNGVIGIRAGLLDQKHIVQPQMNIFCESALPSTVMDEALPKFDGMPD